jgi:chorismate-pyruvate lyase
MDNPVAINFIDSFFRFDTSTTKLIEELTGQKLNVKVVYQKEIIENDCVQFIRMSELILEKLNRIVIYSISSFGSNNMSKEQINELREGIMPIGKIFGVDNISKKNIVVETKKDLRMAKKLHVKSNMVYSKKYELLANGKKIGVIKEFFNEESLKVLWELI